MRRIEQQAEAASYSLRLQHGSNSQLDAKAAEESVGGYAPLFMAIKELGWHLLDAFSEPLTHNPQLFQYNLSYYVLSFILTHLDMPNNTQALETARSRVGLTPTSRVRWLLEFAKLDLSQVTDLDLLPLQQEMVVFLEQANDVSRNRLPRREQMINWQELLAYGLKDLAGGRSWKIEMKERLTAVRKDTRIIDSSTRTSARQDHWPFTFHAINALIQGADSLRFCSNSNCSKIYIRNIRQQYCSIRCRNATNKRIHRQRVRQRAPNRS